MVSLNGVNVHLFNLTKAGALSAAKAEPIMAIKATKVNRILKLEGLCLGFGNANCEMVLEG